MWNSIEMVLKLQHESSALKKQEILREYKDDETFCKLLYYALNPMLTYKISEATLRKLVKYRSDITLTLCDIFDVCKTLSKRKALDDATVYQVCAFCSFVNRERQSFIQSCSPRHYGLV